MIDARTIQLMANAEAERQRATPVLTRRDLEAAIAATRPAAAVPAETVDIRTAITTAALAGREVGRREGMAAGQREAIDVASRVGISMGRALERRGQ